MSTSREVPNPLRPYYIPPTIDIHLDTPVVASSGTYGLGPRNSSAPSYASQARDIFPDINYSDYLSDSSPSSFDSIKKTVDDALYRYIGVLLSQPFDVAKTVLQVRSQDGQNGQIPIVTSGGRNSRSSSYRNSVYDDVWQINST
jgi:fusion and transport protein UGO1